MRLDGLTVSSKSLSVDGFGAVFMSKVGGRLVASKKLTRTKLEYNKLLNEATKFKTLRHGKHIAHTYGIALKDESLYMVMEYSERGDLQSYLKRNKESVTYDQKVLFCRGILLGLLYCHSMKIFHGDIKCSNVILGKNLEPKLTDFGLGMTVDNIESYCKAYKRSQYWAAPELFSMKEESDFEEFKANPYLTDVYSLGATFCEISYDGTTEFLDSEDIEMDILLRLVSPTPKEAFLEELVDKCCQFERSERITLDKCLVELDKIAENKLSTLENDNRWEWIQYIIELSLEQPIPPSFILHRPFENLVVGPSNLSLLEFLCIKDCVEAVKYLFHVRMLDKKQINWLYNISVLCGAQNVTEFLCKQIEHKAHVTLRLSDFMDENPWQFIKSLIEAGADCSDYILMKKAIDQYHNNLVQTIVESSTYLNSWFIHEAIRVGNAEAVDILAVAGVDLKYVDKNENTPLLAAIDAGNAEVVKILLNFNVDVNNENQCTPLHRAVLSGNKEIVALLINAGATVGIESKELQFLFHYRESKGDSSMAQCIADAVDKRNMSSVEESTLLCTAIRNGQFDLVEDLIHGKVDVDERDYNGYAPLHWAVLVSDEEIVKALIDAGADIEIRTPNKDQHVSSKSIIFNEYTPLHIAIEGGSLMLARLLIVLGADLSKMNGLGQTIEEMAAEEDREEIEKIILEYVWISKDSFRKFLSSISPGVMKKLIYRQMYYDDFLFDFLRIAVSHGNKEIVEYLIVCGADVEWTYEGKNLLELAILENQAQIVQILIEKGADVDVRSMCDRTPLFLCVKESQANIAQILVSKGADVNIRDAYGDTPIHFATDIEVAKILIKAGAEIDAIGKYNETALIRCVEASQIKVLKFLIERGANVNIKNVYEKAPIFLTKSREVVKTLVKAGADVNAKDGSGRTPLFHFVEKSHAEIVQFLTDKGADVNTKDNSGSAPIHFARTREIAEILIAYGADVNTKNADGETLSAVLVQEQRKNLSKTEYKKTEVAYLQDFLALE